MFFFFNLFHFIFDFKNIHNTQLWNYYVGFSICHNIRYIACKQIFENVFKTFIVRYRCVLKIKTIIFIWLMRIIFIFIILIGSVM